MVTLSFYTLVSLYCTAVLAAPPVAAANWPSFVDNGAEFGIYKENDLNKNHLSIFFLPDDPECERFCRLAYYNENNGPNVTFTAEHGSWIAHYDGKSYFAKLNSMNELSGLGGVGFVKSSSKPSPTYNTLYTKVHAFTGKTGNSGLVFSLTADFTEYTAFFHISTVPVANVGAIDFFYTRTSRFFLSNWRLKPDIYGLP